MAAFKCKHCGNSVNMHCNINETCFSCGMPVLYDTLLIGTMLFPLPDNINESKVIADRGYHTNQYHCRALKGVKWINGEQVFVDMKANLYIIKKKYTDGYY